MKETYHFLLDPQGRSYYVDAQGKVQYSNTPRPITSPDGWQDLGVAFERDQERRGLIKQYTFPLRLYFDGAQIIRHLWYGKGVDVPLELLVTRRIIEMGDTWYKDFQRKLFKGAVALSATEDSENSVQIKMEENGLARLLKANEGTKYEFPLSHPEAVTVLLDGIPLEETNNFICTEYEKEELSDGFFLTDAGWGNAEGEAAGFSGHQVFDTRIGDSYQEVLSEEDKVDSYLMRTTQLITGIRFKGSRKFGYSSTMARYRIFLYSNRDRVIPLYTMPALQPAGTMDISWDITFDSLGEEKFYLVEEKVASLFCHYSFKKTEMTVSFASTFAPTRCRAFPPAVLGDLIMEKITGKRGLFRSDLLTALPDSGTMLTSGDGIRGLADAKVKLSFNDFFDIYKVVAFCGLGIVADQVRMESVDFFFQNKPPIHLGDAADDGCKVLSANNYMGNAVKIGYREPNIEGNQGKYAFDITHNYSTEAKEVVKEVPLIAPCYADPYKIEGLRIQTAGQNTTDHATDNDIYLLGVEPEVHSFSPLFFTGIEGVKRLQFFFGFPDLFSSEHFPNMQPGLQITLSGTNSNNQTFTIVAAERPFSLTVAEPVQTEFDLSGCTVSYTGYKLRRVVYDKVEGVPDQAGGRLFNVEFMSPKRLLLRHLRWLNSMMYGLEGTYFTFQTTERNPLLATTLGTVEIRENANVLITDDRLFLPFVFQVQLLTELNLIDIMEADPYQTFSFNWRGATMKGFLLSGGTSIGDISSQAYVLLATPDCPIQELENA